MTWMQSLAAEWDTLLHSRLFAGTVVTGIALSALVIALLVLLGVTVLLRIFFKHHPFVNRAQRMLVYLLTMTGVFMLVLAGLLGLALPLIPGIPLLIGALFLLRRYHRWEWIEYRIAKLKRKMHKYEDEAHRLEEVKKLAQKNAEQKGKDEK